MQRAHVMDAGQTGVSAPRDDGAAMASALHRLAALRATIYRDWSGGPSNLVAHVSIDAAVRVRDARVHIYANDPPPLDFADDPAFQIEPAPLELRGRFDCADDMPPALAVADDDDAAVPFGAGAASGLPDGDSASFATIATCEAALWNLPRVVPCGEAFVLTPNHEIAVKITRALRVRTDTPRARAFAEHVAFGALRTIDAHLPWFPSVEIPAGAGSDTIDADTQFAAPGMDHVAVTIRAPDRPPPILSEAELDALLATPTARDSHELDDAWRENPVWRETFWHDVDAYLQSVESADFDETPGFHADAAHPQDIEFRDEDIAATHFWLPGDETDLAIAGDGHDLFLIGGGDAGVVLAEDGTVHAMRTGRGTRIGEVVVSWSSDAWTDIDMMTWTRVATLSNISHLRVEQTATHDRTAVIAGDLSASTLTADRVRLVEATEFGPREFPVHRLGGADSRPGAWPFADLDGMAADERRLLD